MTAHLAQVPSDHIVHTDGVAYIRELSTADPGLLALIADSRDPEVVIQQALSTGARGAEPVSIHGGASGNRVGDIVVDLRPPVLAPVGPVGPG